MANQKSTKTAKTPENDPGARNELERSASELYSEAKTAANETYSKVADRASTAVEEKKSSLADGLMTVAAGLRQTSNEIRDKGGENRVADLTAKWTEPVAERVERAADYFERNDIRSMLRDAQDIARQNPAWFLGGAMAAGVLAARFLKSSRANTANTSSSGQRDLAPMPTREPSSARQPADRP